MKPGDGGIVAALGVRVAVSTKVVLMVLVGMLVIASRPHQHRHLYEECKCDKPPVTNTRTVVVKVPVT